MKLYSKGQVLFISILTTTLVFIFCAGLLLVQNKTNNSQIENSQTKETVVSKNNEKTTDALEDTYFTVADNSNSLNTNFTITTASGNITYTDDEKQNISVYETVNEAVVNITTETMGINWFLEPVPQEGASGSGSIIDKRGYVLTNTHVIADAYKINISLADGSQYPGVVVGTDEENDLAVIKFEPPENYNLSIVPFGDSNNLKVGQKVLAIGNPFGLERTLTTGIVSGLGRPIQSTSENIIKNMIQTDTAINPGNSGGPLLDSQGRMVGINTMIYSTSGSSAGVSFAVPVNTAKRVVSELIQFGKVRRGTIDAELVQLTSSIASYAKLSTQKGLLVSRIIKGSNAERSGLKAGTTAVRYGSTRNSTVIYLGGDIITAIDGQEVSSLTDYYSALEAKKPGETVSVSVLRNKQQLNLNVILSEREN